MQRGRDQKKVAVGGSRVILLRDEIVLNDKEVRDIRGAFDANTGCQDPPAVCVSRLFARVFGQTHRDKEGQVHVFKSQCGLQNPFEDVSCLQKFTLRGGIIYHLFLSYYGLGYASFYSHDQKQRLDPQWNSTQLAPSPADN
jgi:hypothetical protein